MNIDFFNFYKKSIDFFADKIKTIAIAIVVLIFSFETSNVILEIIFADKPVLNQSTAAKIQIRKIDQNPFLSNYDSKENSNALLNAIKACLLYTSPSPRDQ